MFPILFFLSFFGVLILAILLFRMANRYFPKKRKYLIPLLLALLLLPILEESWAFDIGNWPPVHQEGYALHHSWYTFDSRQPLAGFVYYQIGSVVHLPTVLALVDVLFLGILLCLPVYLITLVRSSQRVE